MDNIEDFLATRQPTAQRPLLGLTVLLVEDSRFACEAVRLMCMHSGARIRRADTLMSARRHLSVYRPSVVIVDVGLPDGSGLNLLEMLVKSSPRIDVILGTSGDIEQEEAVLATGANGFLAKPLAHIGAFQSAILAHLPQNRQPPGPRLVNADPIEPDILAFHDDLSHVAEVLRGPQPDTAVDYVTQFLSGVARSADDVALGRAVARLSKLREDGAPLHPGLTELAALVERRLSAGGPI